MSSVLVQPRVKQTLSIYGVFSFLRLVFQNNFVILAAFSREPLLLCVRLRGSRAF